MPFGVDQSNDNYYYYDDDDDDDDVTPNLLILRLNGSQPRLGGAKIYSLSSIGA